MVKGYNKMLTFYAWTLCTLCCSVVAFQSGPDPWNLEDNGISDKIKIDKDVPPDLRILPKKKVHTESNLGNGEWFFRRILGIVLKGGQFKKNDDGSVDISLQMKIYEEEWNTLDGLLKSETPFSEDVYRRSVGYIEQAIYQPSIADKIVMAWGDYVQIYLSEYKSEITWALAILAVAVTLFWLWNHMSHKHLVGAVFLALYFYEVFVSYKEAEKQDLDRFLTALNSCQWYNIWSSKCEAPKPDPIIFLKHMNPLKIALRMFTTLISEPMIVLSDTLKTLVHGMTDGLWYPFDKIVYGILIITFNVLLMFLLITILFNFFFNIPIDLGYFGISLRLKQRNRAVFSESSNRNERGTVDNEQREILSNKNNQNNEDRISGSNLQRVLDICAKALNTASGNGAINQKQISGSSSNNVGLRRSASTGRLPNTNSNIDVPTIADFRKRKNVIRIGGTGDAS